MKKNMSKTIVFIVFPVILYTFFGMGCSLLKPGFDPEGYQFAVTVRDDSSILIKKARESYEKYKDEVYRLMTRVEQAYEHARMMGKNDAVTGLWNQMRDLQGNRLGRFMEEWESEGILDDATITKYSAWIADDLKTLIDIENKKKK